MVYTSHIESGPGNPYIWRSITSSSPGPILHLTFFWPIYSPLCRSSLEVDSSRDAIFYLYLYICPPPLSILPMSTLRRCNNWGSRGWAGRRERSAQRRRDGEKEMGEEKTKKHHKGVTKSSILPPPSSVLCVETLVLVPFEVKVHSVEWLVMGP